MVSGAENGGSVTEASNGVYAPGADGYQDCAMAFPSGVAIVHGLKEGERVATSSSTRKGKLAGGQATLLSGALDVGTTAFSGADAMMVEGRSARLQRSQGRHAVPRPSRTACPTALTALQVSSS